MDIRSYARVAQAQWHLLLAALVLGLAASAVVTVQTPPSYASDATLFLTTQRASSDSALAYEGSLLAEQKADSYVELVTSEQILGEVIAQMELDRTPRELAQDVSATLLPSTALIAVRVTDRSPEGAQQIATVLVDRIGVLVEDLEEPEGLGPAALQARVVEPPTFSSEPVSPQPVLNLALGGILGLLAGLGLALLWNAVRRPVRRVDELFEATSAPVLGVVPRDRSLPASPLALVDRPGEPTAEAFRRIRARFAMGTPRATARVVAVVSASRGEGRTVTACNLAVALARAGRRVALVDADLRHSAVGSILSTGDGPGLLELLQHMSPDEVPLRPWGNGPDVMTAGMPPIDAALASDALASDRLSRLITTLAASHDIVLLDTPPLLEFGDAMAIAPLCDGVIFVARYNKTRVPEIRAAMSVIQPVSVVIGTVLNGGPRRYQRLIGNDVSREPSTLQHSAQRPLDFTSNGKEAWDSPAHTLNSNSRTESTSS